MYEVARVERHHPAWLVFAVWMFCCMLGILGLLIGGWSYQQLDLDLPVPVGGAIVGLVLGLFSWLATFWNAHVNFWLWMALNVAAWCIAVPLLVFYIEHSSSSFRWLGGSILLGTAFSGPHAVGLQFTYEKTWLLVPAAIISVALMIFLGPLVTSVPLLIIFIVMFFPPWLPGIVRAWILNPHPADEDDFDAEDELL